MRLLEEVEVRLDRRDLANRVPLRRPEAKPRSPGIHLSSVLKHILRSSRMPGWQQYEQDGGEQVPLLWVLGIAWEEAAVSLCPEIVWQPGEVCRNGIWMTCDGLAAGDSGLVIEEFKYTTARRKTWTGFSGDWMKMMQGKGYCAGYGADTVRWHVLWNGELRNPQYVRYVVAFEEREIDSAWAMVTANRDGAVEAGYGE